MTRRVLTDMQRLASLREAIEAARGDWHEATALLSVGADLHWLLDRAAAGAALEKHDADLAVQREDAPLDAAWREAEAALPEGWAIVRMERDEDAFGIAAFIPVNRALGWRWGRGPTPAAALQALAARLRERAVNEQFATDLGAMFGESKP